jgi:hypothetical protein
MRFEIVIVKRSENAAYASKPGNAAIMSMASMVRR